MTRLFESKAYGTLPRKKYDLRALEARAFAIVNAREHKAIVKQQSALAAKKLVTLKNKMRVALIREVQSWKSGEISYSTLISRSRSFIDTTYREAFAQGLRAQGHGALRGRRGTKLSPTTELTPEDSAWISSAVAEEMTYWTRFMKSMTQDYDEIEKAVYDAEKRRWHAETERVKRTDLTGRQAKRLNMYVATVDSVYDVGKVQGAGDYAVIDWVLGDAEHCPECIYLEKHSPYTKRTLPCTPRSGCTRCLSNCKCHLVITPAPQKIVDAMNKAKKNSKYFLKQLERSKRLRSGLPEVAKEHMKAEIRAKIRKTKRKR